MGHISTYDCSLALLMPRPTFSERLLVVDKGNAQVVIDFDDIVVFRTNFHCVWGKTRIVFEVGGSRFYAKHGKVDILS